MPSLNKRVRPRDERAALLRNAWSGENKGRLNTNPRPQHENLLEGILYNALSRKTAGKTLSKLEERLIGFASKFADDEAELDQYGRLFQESKKTYRSNMQRLYPDVLLSRNEDQPFTNDDLIDYAVEISGDLAAMPQNDIIDLAQVQGSFETSEEYNMAVKQAGRGSLFFDSSSPTINADMTNQGELVAKRFRVFDAPGDASGSRAELYFTWSSGADNGETKKYKTKTWGAIVDDDEYNFPSDNNLIFTGKIEYCMFAYISLWEEDDSDDDWVDALVDFAQTVSEDLMETAQDTAKSPNREAKKAAAYQAIAAMVAFGLAQLIDAFRNKDDLVGERTIGFTKAGLGEFWGRPDAEIGFDISNKMGNVNIYLHGAIHGPDIAKAIWQANGYPDSSWTSPAQVNTALSAGALSWEGMSMTNFNGDLVGCWCDTDSGRIMWSKYNDSSATWSQPLAIGDYRGFGRVTICAWDGTLWLAYRNSSDHVNLITTTGNQLTSWKAHWGNLTLVPGFAYMIVLHRSTDFGPAMAILDHRLVMAAKMMGSESIHYTVKARGSNEWRPSSSVEFANSNVAPTLVNFGGDIYLLWVSAVDGHIVYNRFDPSDESWDRSGNTGLQSSGSVGACEHGVNLWLAYRAKEKDTYTVKYALFQKTVSKTLRLVLAEQPVPESGAYSGVQVGSHKKLFVSYGKPT